LTALFPPGKGGGEEVAYGGKEKYVLINTLAEVMECPWLTAQPQLTVTRENRCYLYLAK
jgi:hypothetical protein